MNNDLIAIIVERQTELAIMTLLLEIITVLCF